MRDYVREGLCPTLNGHTSKQAAHVYQIIIMRCYFGHSTND